MAVHVKVLLWEVPLSRPIGYILKFQYSKKKKERNKNAFSQYKFGKVQKCMEHVEELDQYRMVWRAYLM